jgi:hypothetical protein
MKKLMATLALCAVCAAGAFAQSFSTDYVIKNFAGTRIAESGALVGGIKYVKGVSQQDKQIFGGLGRSGMIDTPAELISMSAVLNIQPVEPQDALKVYAEIAIEGAVNQYLGVTGTTHKEVLDRLQTKYKFSQNQIDNAIKQYILDAVNTEFAKTRNSYRPATIYADWKQRGFGDAIGTVTDVLSEFFKNPSLRNYEAVRGIVARQANLVSTRGDMFAGNASYVAIYAVIRFLAPALADNLNEEVRPGTSLALAKVPDDPRLNVFSMPYVR